MQDLMILSTGVFHSYCDDSFRYHPCPFSDLLTSDRRDLLALDGLIRRDYSNRKAHFVWNTHTGNSKTADLKVLSPLLALRHIFGLLGHNLPFKCYTSVFSCN